MRRGVDAVLFFLTEFTDYGLICNPVNLGNPVFVI